MYVMIGKHKNFIGCYQIADTLKKFGVSEDTCHTIGEWLSNTPLKNFFEWLETKRKRNVIVKINDYDVWNMDGTLSYIVLPMLVKLKKQKHGAPFVDDEDVPEHLRSTSAPPKENEWDADDNHFLRWDWVMDELIWTFEQLHPDSDWESQYHSGEIDMQFKPIEKTSADEEQSYEMVKGPKDTHVFDKEGYVKHEERINNGCRLFGKYFRALWD